MNSRKRFPVISILLFCAAVTLTACSKSSDNGQPSQPSQSAGIARHTFLNAVQVVSSTPPVSTATGTADVILDTTTSRLTGTVVLANVNAVTAVRIKDGDAGNNGDEVLTLTAAGGGVWTIPDTAEALSAAQADRFKAAGLYVIAETSTNPGGEIRGQLLSYADNIQPIFNQHCTVCHINGGLAATTGLFLTQNESFSLLVNQPASQTAGIRVIPFDADNSVLFERISGIGLAAGARQMPPGGPFLSQHDGDLIRVWINMGAIPDSGGLASQIIRRAILTDKLIVSAAPVTVTATGTAAFALDATASRLTGTVTLANVTNAATAVHINDGDPGSNGNSVVSLTETSAGSGIWTIPDAPQLSAAQVKRFKTAGFYVIVDTAANPDGEIRGQLLSYEDNIQPIFSTNCASCHYPLGPAAFTGMILSPGDSYGNLVNLPAARSIGLRVIPFDADNSVLYQRITGTGFTAVVEPTMPPPNPEIPSLFTPLDQELIKAWINMGAMDNNGVAQAAAPFPGKAYSRNAILNDVQVVTTPSVSSAATGTATMVLDSGTGLLSGTVVLSNITNTVIAVHINDGDADSNGDPIASLTETPPGSGIWTVPSTAAALAPIQMNRFLTAGFYVSVDTVANPNGEIRGQFQNFKDNIQPIFSCRCVKCHQPFAIAGYTGLILQPDVSYGNLVNQLATQTTGTRVMPFDDVDSILMQRIRGAGSVITISTLRMPQDGPPFLSLHQENVFKVWINTGAAND